MYDHTSGVETKDLPQDIAGCVGTTAVVDLQPSTDTGHDAPGQSLQGKKTMSENRTLISYSADLSDAEAPSPLPVGQYPAEIISAEVKTSANTGNDYMSVQFRISPDAYPADFVDGDPDGTVMNFNRIPVDDSLRGRYRMRKFLEAIGAKTSKQVDTTELVGLAAVVSIKHSEWEGEKRAEIEKVVGNG